jgi:hypothetical protein
MERFDSINQRLQQRNIGNTPPFYFSPRPVPTKYVALPMIDQQFPTMEVIHPRMFSVEDQFLPATTNPGYSQYVDIESILQSCKGYKPSNSMYKEDLPKETVTVLPKWNQSTSSRMNS